MIIYYYRYLGFFGSTPDVLNYALKLLASEHLVELRTEVVPNCKPSMTISVCQELDKLSRLMAYAHQVVIFCYTSHSNLCSVVEIHVNI